MAKGWSGSPRSTETKGSGEGMGGAPAPRGIRIGPGPMASKVRPDFDRNAGKGDSKRDSDKR